jgi:hypothetical protein
MAWILLRLQEKRQDQPLRLALGLWLSRHFPKFNPWAGNGRKNITDEEWLSLPEPKADG